MSLTYPPGFYEASMEEQPTHYFFELNYNEDPEMNFNQFVYFYPTGVNRRHVVNELILRHLVANPQQRQNRMNNLMMVNEAGVIFPAHLPNIADVVGRIDVQEAIVQLEQDPDIVYEGVTKIIPQLIINKIDPKPVIPREGPIYTLKMHNANSHFGSYSDSVQFLKVGCDMSAINFSVFRDILIEQDPSSRYQGVRLQPELENGSNLLPFGATFVLWNARRITRPSFIIHFREIINTHNPIFIVLTEVGGGSRSCNKVLGNIGTRMRWRVDVGGGILGGSAIPWDPTRVSATVTVAQSPTIDLRLIGSLTGIRS